MTTDRSRMGVDKAERRFKVASEIGDDDLDEQATRIGRHFFVTEFSHPALFEAFETIMHDSGGGAGHHRYPVPNARAADAQAADRALQNLLDRADDSFGSIVIGDEDDMLAWMEAHPDNARAHELMNLFFEGWHDDFPITNQSPDEPKKEAFSAVSEEARELFRSSPPIDDLAAARLIATTAIETYGDLGEAAYAQFKSHGVWNDHAAVQAALAAIRLVRDGTIA